MTADWQLVSISSRSQVGLTSQVRVLDRSELGYRQLRGVGWPNQQDDGVRVEPYGLHPSLR